MFVISDQNRELYRSLKRPVVTICLIPEYSQVSLAVLMRSFCINNGSARRFSTSTPPSIGKNVTSPRRFHPAACIRLRPVELSFLPDLKNRQSTKSHRGYGLLPTSIRSRQSTQHPERDPCYKLRLVNAFRRRRRSTPKRCISEVLFKLQANVKIRGTSIYDLSSVSLAAADPASQHQIHSWDLYRSLPRLGDRCYSDLFHQGNPHQRQRAEYHPHNRKYRCCSYQGHRE